MISTVLVPPHSPLLLADEMLPKDEMLGTVISICLVFHCIVGRGRTVVQLTESWVLGLI